MAHSGRGVYRDKAACSAVVKDGPLPLRKYWNVTAMKGNGFLKREEELRMRPIRCCRWL
ncbi:TPA: hypothetical protein ACHV5N_003066 [Klebsiella variicola]|uniref:hypothetical protein n=1 Tax=Klebsiella TaxID=570 RepID=UPI00299E38FC|nr:hypothetical protein [Klebsiella variicola]